MVLVVSTAVDSATDEVVGLLRTRGKPVLRVNTEEMPYHSEIALSWDDQGVVLEIGRDRIRPSAIWYRRLRSPCCPPDMEEGIHKYCVRESISLIRGLAMTAACRVMSRPSAIHRAENKPYQLHVARRVGLTVPKTCITNEPIRALEFIDSVGQAVCKPVRRGWYESDGSDWSIYTSRVDDRIRENIEQVRYAPVIFQKEIPKLLEYRVTIVGRRMFIAAIDSQSDPAATVDWRRTSNAELPHHAATLPPWLQTRLRALMEKLELNFGAIDLVKTPEGDFVFLEINPNGQWLWIDDALSLGITDSVADWLAGS